MTPRENENCRVWEGEDARCRSFTVGAHWGCPVLWLTIHYPMPRHDGRVAKHVNGLILTRDQALYLAFVLEGYGRTGELPPKLPPEKRQEWLELLRIESSEEDPLPNAPN